MFIDNHTHGAHAERNSAGKLAQPLMTAWVPGKMTPQEYVKSSQVLGIEKIVLLDPPKVTFELKRIFGDYVIPVPQVDMDISSPDEIDRLFEQGTVGIKFISPEKSYGHDSYFLDDEGCRRGIKNMMDFYVRFMERLKVPEELRQKVYRDNILMLTTTGK